MELNQRIAIFNQYSVGQVVTADSPGGAALTAAHMRSVAEATIEHGTEAGQELLQPFAVSPLGPIKLRAPGSSTKLNAKERRGAEVLIHDEFKCRYCDSDLIIRAAHELLATIFPQQYPYHSNGKIGYYHPAQWWLEYACDHVVPRSRGGTDAVPNRVAACWWHNDRKRNLSLERYLPAPGVIAAEIVEDLQAALTEFTELANSLQGIGVEFEGPTFGDGRATG